VSPVELAEGGGGLGERSQIIRPRESLAFFKSVNTLWYFTIEISRNFLFFLVNIE
jgi:hypothetical protein